MKIICTALTLLTLLFSGFSVATENESNSLATFIEKKHRFYAFREKIDLPIIPTRDEIEEALTGDIIVKKGESPSTGLYYVWAAKIMDVDIVNLWLTLLDREHYDQILPNISESFISKQFDQHFYSYNVLDAPLISTRHQVLDAAVSPLLYAKSGSSMWEHFWHLAPEINTQIKDALSQNKLENTTLKDLKDAVAIRHHDGAWLIFSLPDGRTWAESYSMNNPGGNIPEWILRKVASTATKKTINAYETWATNNVIAHINNEHAIMLSPDGKWMPPTEILKKHSK